MFSELAVVASLMMLSSAQHFQPYQLSQFPSVQPVQISSLGNSQLFMMHSANAILNQDFGTPLQPGLLSGVPVVVNEATQNILDQESKVIGYHQSPKVSPLTGRFSQQSSALFLPQFQHRHRTQVTTLSTPSKAFISTLPRTVRVNPRDAVVKNSYVKIGRPRHVPQSLAIPVLNNLGRLKSSDHVPVRAIASLKDLLNPQKAYSKGSSHFSFKSKLNYRQPDIQWNKEPINSFVRLPTLEYFFDTVPKPNSESINPHVNLYDDIPQNHPVPPPPTVEPPQFQAVSTHPISTDVYYDIPPNHPVPPPPQTHSNSFGEANVDKPKHFREEFSTGIASQGSIGAPQDAMGDYAPAHPPPPPPPQPLSYPEQTTESEIIGMMPPLPYKEEIQETKETQAAPSVSQHPTDRNYSDKSAKVPGQFANDRRESPRQTRRKQSSDTSTERSRRSESESGTTKNGSTRRKNSQKSQRRKSKSGAKSAQRNRAKTAHSDADTSASENVYQQVVPYPDNFSSEKRGYYTNQDTYSSNRALIHKHIFVHEAPQQAVQVPKARIISPPQEKHVNIIFIKSPTPSPEPQTIVQLPPQEHPKTLVYVLSQKSEDAERNVKIISPPKSKPPPPEIFFIRYASSASKNQGYPVPNLQSLYDSYGSFSDSSALPPPTLSYRHKRNKIYGLNTYAPLMAYSTTGQINEITQEEADVRRTKLDDFF